MLHSLVLRRAARRAALIATVWLSGAGLAACSSGPATSTPSTVRVQTSATTTTTVLASTTTTTRIQTSTSTTRAAPKRGTREARFILTGGVTATLSSLHCSQVGPLTHMLLTGTSSDGKSVRLNLNGDGSDKVIVSGARPLLWSGRGTLVIKRTVAVVDRAVFGTAVAPISYSESAIVVTGLANC